MLKIPYQLFPFLLSDVTYTLLPFSRCTFSGTGNRCGHDPKSMRHVTYHNSDKRPPVIKWAIERLRKFGRGEGGHLKTLQDKVNLNGQTRAHRSDGLESLMNMGEILFHNLELETMTIRKDDLVYNSPTLQELVGNKLSLSRARRALNKYVKKGMIEVTQQYYQSHNLYKALACIKKVKYAFFSELGLGSCYTTAISYKAHRAEKRRTKRTNKLKRVDLHLKNEIKTKNINNLPQTIELLRKKLTDIYTGKGYADYVSLIARYPYARLRELVELHSKTDPP